jgi:hypothetical protein
MTSNFYSKLLFKISTEIHQNVKLVIISHVLRIYNNNKKHKSRWSDHLKLVIRIAKPFQRILGCFGSNFSQNFKQNSEYGFFFFFFPFCEGYIYVE